MHTRALYTLDLSTHAHARTAAPKASRAAEMAASAQTTQLTEEHAKEMVGQTHMHYTIVAHQTPLALSPLTLMVTHTHKLHTGEAESRTRERAGAH